MADGDSHAVFDSISAEIRDTIRELKGQGDFIAKFRKEYARLYQALEKSHGSEQRMVNKTKSLIQDIAKHNENIARAKKDEEDLHHTKKRLEEETAKAFQDVASHHRMVLKKRQEANELTAITERLQAQLAMGAGWNEDQLKVKAEYEEELDKLRHEAEQKLSQVRTQREQVATLTEQLQEAEEEKEGIDTEIASIRGEIEEKKAEAGAAQRRKDGLDKDLKAYKGRIEAFRRELAEKQRRIREGDEEILTIETSLKGSRAQMDSFLKDYDALHQKTIRLTDDLDNQMHTNQLLANDLNEREGEIFRKRHESEQVEREDERLVKLNAYTARKIAKVDADKEALDERKRALKQQMDEIQMAIEQERKASEVKKKEIEDMVREREILNKKLVKGSDRTRHTEDLIKIHKNTRKNLENEVAGYRAHALRQRETIETLQEDRKRYAAEAEEANQRYYTALEQVKLQEMQVAQLQRRIVEGETKLKQQQNLYEAVRSDRNLYSKNLIESQEEIDEMRRRFKIMNHHIDQLKEEITTKDHSLVKEHFDHHKVEKEKENLRNELTRVQKQIQSSEHIIQNQDAEMQKLAQIIQEADEERQRQQKEYDAVVSERDILGSQLIRRDEELSTLYEKIKIQKSTLAKGAAQFNERLKTIQEIMNRISELRKELELSKTQVANVDDLRGEVFRLQRELLRERIKIKSLTEELGRPLNVHRWRKLEGSDPQKFELIRRIQSLQKRLIKTTEEAVECDLLIQEKERLYVELKNILARQPGPEVAEQLAVYQTNLKQKQKQMRAMSAELDMYKAQVNEYKYEIERLNADMHKARQEYFALMRKRRDGMEGADSAGGSAEGFPVREDGGVEVGGDGLVADVPPDVAAYMHGDLDGATAGEAPGTPTGPGGWRPEVAPQGATAVEGGADAAALGYRQADSGGGDGKDGDDAGGGGGGGGAADDAQDAAAVDAYMNGDLDGVAGAGEPEAKSKEDAERGGDGGAGDGPPSTAGAVGGDQGT